MKHKTHIDIVLYVRQEYLKKLVKIETDGKFMSLNETVRKFPCYNFNNFSLVFTEKETVNVTFFPCVIIKYMLIYLKFVLLLKFR